ncbi:MAG TPA: Ig-like domain-containing protein [Paludibacter sp.]|nr:Ig-like domain-containing protein [Paludibacter sp.]
MKKIFITLAIFLSFMQISAQTLDRTMLIDFGPTTQATYSQLTANPDAKNNYWNNFTNNTASSASLALIDKANNATGIFIKTLVDFQVNATPGAPGISDPAQLNAAALGDLAIPSATVDYFFTTTTVPSLKFTGLSAGKGYKFYVFGSRLSSTDTRISQYTFTGVATTVGTLKTSEANLGGTGIHANNSSTYTTPILFAAANGEIKLELVAQTGGFGYINIIKVEEYSGVGTVKVTDISVSGNSTIDTDGGTAQMTVTVLPANATVKDYAWRVSDPKIATINSAGLLTARKNGTVTVTATTTESGSIVAGSKQVVISNQPVSNREVFMDFGPNDGTNGDLTPVNTADVFGNYWNNVSANMPGGITPVPAILATNLVDKSNAQSAISVTVNTSTIFTNGKLNGALLTPNMNYLGELGIATATEDYFCTSSNGTLTFAGLDATKAYRFRIFGARETTETRISGYTFTGSNTVIGTLQTSGANLGGAGINTNNSGIYVSDMLYPNSSGVITLYLDLKAAGYAYINAMKLEEFDRPFVSVSSVTANGADISTSGTASQMTAVIAPENASVTAVNWTVDDSSVATIDANGLLHPLKNGAVTVTATSKQTGTAISGSKQINITNQISVLYLSGTATENGDNVTTALAMNRLTDGKGYPTGIFEVYTTLKDAGTLNFYSSQSNDAVVYGGTTGTLAETGPAIDPTESGLVLISVNMGVKTYTIRPTTTIGVVGAAGEALLSYKGDGIWSAVVNMGNVVTDADLKFSFRINSNAGLVLKRITGTVNTLRLESTATALSIPVEQITTDKNSYSVTLDLNNYTYTLACPSLDKMKIALMGSSVAFGTGATNNQGYNYLFTQLLAQRYSAAKGLNWAPVNISVPGNNTITLGARMNSDLFSLCGKYVIFGLSLGNEGIHGAADQQAIFNQFKNNMLNLIALARSKGLVPVVTNCYTRNDYTLVDYGYIKQMDMLIHEWNVPSVNLLGAVDDGTGKWASGYWSDDLHPNDIGHREFSYAMVPSMFDALDAAKPLPQRASGNFMTFDNNTAASQLVYTPDNTVHSFTVSFDFKTTTNGVLFTFKHVSLTGELKVEAQTGMFVYTSPLNAASQIKSAAAVNDGQWHKVTLTHFFARGETDLYIDNTFAGKLSERLVPTAFRLNDLQSPKNVSYRDWFFYRAGMNADEISALCAGKMLKSGLELYAPLYGQGAAENQLANVAQSTTTVTKVQLSTGIKVPKQFSNVKLYPNPVQRSLRIDGLDSDKEYDCTVYNMDGRVALTESLKSGNELNVSLLAASQYILLLKEAKTTEQITFSFTKQ